MPQGLKTSPTSFGELLARAVTPMCVGDLLTTSKVSAKYRKNNYSANADGMAPRRRLKYVSNKSCTWVSSSARENMQLQAQEHLRQTQLRGSGERQDSVELGSRTQALKGHDLELLTCMKEH